MRKALAAIAAASSLLVTDAAIAQDASGGIWAARPRPRRVVHESVPASALPGLMPGLTVQNSEGRAIGRISRVLTNEDGSIRKVVALSPAGNFLNLSPSSLTISGQVVTKSDE